jgi:hypothetical protein
MNKSRCLVLALIPLALTVAPAPAGNGIRACSIAYVGSDPDIRASFERFDRYQSAGAATICDIYLHHVSLEFPAR